MAGIISTTLAGDDISASVLPNGDNHDWIRGIIDPDSDGRFETKCRGIDRTFDSASSPALDADGDGYLESADTCPGLFNPCQDPADMDGDGTPDECDSCPSDPFITGTGDLDMDGVDDECDNCPTTPNRDQSNLDHDALGDVCDPCPRHIDVSFDDGDGDGVFDTCDNCPTVANPEQGDHQETAISFDPFGRPGRPDGIGDACDNCQYFNPRQANCNLDAELEAGIYKPNVDPALHAPGVGDVCDPTPCGDTLENRRPVTVSSGGDVLYVQTLTVDARGWDDSSPPARPTRSEKLGFRFCPCADAVEGDDLATRTRCVLDFGCPVNALEYPRPDPSPGTPGWRRITTTEAPAPGGVATWPPAPGDLGSETALTDFESPEPHLSGYVPFEADRFRLWDVAEDIDRWSAADANGLTWTHSRTTDADPAVRTLQSHYLSTVGVVEWDPGSIAISPPLPCLNYVGPLLDWSEPFPLPAIIGADLFDSCHHHDEPSIGLEAGFLEEGPPGLLDPFKGITDPTFVVPASDPELPPPGAKPPVYLLLDGQGAMAARVEQTPAGYQTVPLPSGGKAFPGAEWALSAIESRAYVIGGPVKADELWVFDDLNAPSGGHTVSLSRALGDPLATAYDPSGRTLTVADRVGGNTVRLLAIDVLTGVVTIRGAWPGSDTKASYAVAVGIDGTVALAASTPGAGQTLLWVTGANASGEYSHGKVGGELVADSHLGAARAGFSLVVDQGNGPVAIAIGAHELVALPYDKVVVF